MKKTIDYKKIGLKSGIEIHAQLEGKKLFCSCPTIIREDEPHFKIKRKLKAVVGETGVVDEAASAEQVKNKDFIYYGYDDTTCLVEIDEEPPHIMNKGALMLCLQMCKHLNSRIVDEVQIMRKTVIDGSNTTGFQRTALVGYNGNLEISNKKILIDSVAIEEDSAKIVNRNSGQDIYNISRLGIPLIEIATAPNMNTPAEVIEVAEKIGMYLRSLEENTCQSIKRGLGTIRQDINVSVVGGNRVEIKGAQDLKLIKDLIDNEISRQLKLIEIQKRIDDKKLILDFKNTEIKNITTIFKNTECSLIKKSMNSNGDKSANKNKCVVLAIKLPNFSGILGESTTDTKRIGSEISDYAKKAGVGGIIHSDEKITEKYGISVKEINAIKIELKVDEKDAFIVVVDEEVKAKSAILNAIKRLNRLNEGVIKEVRKANLDGTTSYMRPMPGGARMYPETDTLPIIPDLDNVKVGMTIEERVKEYQKLGIKDGDIANIIAREYFEIFNRLSDDLDLDVNFLAVNLVSGSKIISPSYEIYKPIFKAIQKETISRNSFGDILKLIKDGDEVNLAISKKENLPKKEVEKIVDLVISEIGSVDSSKIGLIMGKVMIKAEGRVDGKLANEIIREKLR